MSHQPVLRPLKNTTFCLISALALWNAKPIPLGLGSNFNPRNIQYITAVKIFARLELRQNSAFFKGLILTFLLTLEAG